MFATKAARTNFRVDSRIGLCVAQSTVYDALKEMAKQKQSDLKRAIDTCICYLDVSVLGSYQTS